MYLDLASEQKKTQQQWNTKVTVILMIIGKLGTVSLGLVTGLEE